MKNLANCKPSEFFKQTVKIRRYAEDWMKSTNILEIRKTAPTLADGMSEEEKAEAYREQAKKNLWDMFDKVFEENAEKTIGIIALACFIEPEKADDHEVGDYLQAVSELINDTRVLNFFTSLLRLDQMNILSPAKR